MTNHGHQKARTTLLYNKLFTKILDSTIWLESAHTRLVWITLLAAMDEDGFCPFATPANVANRANIPLDDTKAALETLMGPDVDSSDPENGGRRLERVPGGYIVLNAIKYREQVSRVEVKRLNRDRVRKHRDSKVQEDIPVKGGFVYYAQNGNRVKIGWSINPWARINDLRCACPDIVLLATEKGLFSLENERHKQFDQYRVEREWFDLSEEIQAHIVSVLSATKTTSVVTTNELRNDSVMQSDTDTDTDTDTETDQKALALTADAAPAAGVFELPLIGGSEWQVLPKFYEELVLTYPGISVMGELQKMRMWLIANPIRGKTLKGMARAVNSWMDRAQNSNRGGSNGKQNKAAFSDFAR